MAVSPDGSILDFQSVVVRDGGLKAADWRLFLHLLMPKLGVYVPGRPWHLQPSNCVVMFDNAPIHNVMGDTFLGNNGVPFLRLPSYSPDLQPIEGVFNDLKGIIRNLVYVRLDLLHDPHLLQARASSFITRRQVIGQFDRVDKVLASILVEYIPGARDRTDRLLAPSNLSYSPAATDSECVVFMRRTDPPPAMSSPARLESVFDLTGSGWSTWPEMVDSCLNSQST